MKYYAIVYFWFYENGGYYETIGFGC